MSVLKWFVLRHSKIKLKLYSSVGLQQCHNADVTDHKASNKVFVSKCIQENELIGRWKKLNLERKMKH